MAAWMSLYLYLCRRISAVAHFAAAGAKALTILVAGNGTTKQAAKKVSID
jgi:hypothetical protein